MKLIIGSLIFSTFTTLIYGAPKCSQMWGGLESDSNYETDFTSSDFKGLYANVYSIGNGQPHKISKPKDIVPWNLNPFSKGFGYLLRNLNTEDHHKYSMQADYCGTDMKFRGLRYIKNNDPTFMLLFDKAGYIAGIQYGMSESSYTPSSAMKNHPAVKDVINGKNYWVLTAYFVDPSIICTTGRNASQFAKYGTGDRFLIQNGTTATQNNFINIPLQESKLTSDWTGPKCFYTMGNHYWYKASADMSCDDFFPFCLLYNNGFLNAFCFATNAQFNDPYVDSPHPSAKVLNNFFPAGKVPKCFAENPAYASQTTMHVYMTGRPRSGGTLC